MIEALRVLMIAPTPFFSDRGCHVRIFEEARALRGAGAGVLIVTYPNGNDVVGIETVRVGKWTGYKKAEAGPHILKPFLDILLFFKALKIAYEFKPHIIHAHLHEGCLIGALIAKILGVELVFDYQGSLTRELEQHSFIERGGIVYNALLRLEKFINRLPNAILPSSSALEKDLKELMGVKIIPLLDALDAEEFCREKDEKVKEKLGIPFGRFVVGYLGLLNEYQGVDLLLETIKHIKDVGSSEEFYFLIMGYPRVEEYHRKAESLGISDMVKITGRVAYSDAGKMLLACDVGVAPKIALTESNGKVLTYMACGLPTVAFDTEVNRELLGDVGWYVNWDGDVRRGSVRLAEALIRLKDDKNLREELSIKGKERVRRFFNRGELARGLLRVYGWREKTV